MSWKKKKFHKGKNEFYSVAKKLRKEGKITEDFEIMISSLLLEEVIALKLEMAAKAAGGALYGVPLWYSMKDIAKDAVLKYAYSATRTKKEASRFLGITQAEFRQQVKKRDIESFFKEDQGE